MAGTSPPVPFQQMRSDSPGARGNIGSDPFSSAADKEPSSSLDTLGLDPSTIGNVISYSAKQNSAMDTGGVSDEDLDLVNDVLTSQTLSDSTTNEPNPSAVVAGTTGTAANGSNKSLIPDQTQPPSQEPGLSGSEAEQLAAAQSESANATSSGEVNQYSDELDKSRLRLLGTFWTVMMAAMATMLFIIFIILVSQKYDEEEDVPCMDYTVSFPLSGSANFSIDCYNVFNDTSLDSNITSPRALRSAWWAGSTMLFVGSSDTDWNRAYVLVDWDSDGFTDDEYVIFESDDVNRSFP